MLYILAPLNIVEKYPYSASQLRRDNPQTSFPTVIPDSLMESYGVYPVKQTQRPEYNPIMNELREKNPILVGNEWTQVWEVVDLPPEVVAENQAAALQALKATIAARTQERLDNFARTREYSGILSLCTYANSSIEKFSAEGQYGVSIRDATWATLYDILNDIETGQRPMPSGFEDIESELPEMIWPV